MANPVATLATFAWLQKQVLMNAQILYAPLPHRAHLAVTTIRTPATAAGGAQYVSIVFLDLSTLAIQGPVCCNLIVIWNFELTGSTFL